MNYRTRLTLNRLETRTTPSVNVVFNNGNLFVNGDNIANDIAVVGSGANLFTVTCTTPAFQSYGPFAATNITVNGNNNSDTISFAGGLTPLQGNLTINTGLSSPAGNLVNLSGLVTGRMSVNGGLGSDSVSMVGFTATGIVHTFNGGLAADVLTMDAASSLGGTTVIGGFNQVTFGGPADSVVISNQSEGLPTSVTATNLINGNLTVNGGNHDDALILRGQVMGSVVFNGGASVTGNSFVQDSLSTTAGNVSLIAGNGNDSAVFQGTAKVNGATNINFGNGNNNVSLVAGFVNGGSLNYVTANGDDVLSQLGSVLGALTFNAGNGANSFVMTGLTVGATTFYGGGGVDSVFVSGAFPGTFRAYMYGSNDIVNLFGASFGSATVEMGVGDDFSGYIGPSVVNFPYSLSRPQRAFNLAVP